MSKITLFSVLITIPLFGQDPTAFVGSLSFDYTGLGGTGSFTADFTEDTSSGAGAAQWVSDDTTFLVISAAQPSGDDAVDLFLMMMRDSTGAGISDQTIGIFNPFDPFPSVILMEDVDSAFAAGFLDVLPDSADIADADSTEFLTDTLFAEIIGLLIENAYMNVSGAISFTSSDSDSVTGTFNGLLTPTNPFYAKTITNGRFNLYPVELPVDLAVNELTIAAPSDFQITAMYPNPFNPAATIEFSVNRPSILRLDIYNLKGNVIKTLFDNNFSPGSHTVVWYPKQIPSGVYFCFLLSPTSSVSKKLLYIK